MSKEEIDRYALGYQDTSKYKSFILSNGNTSTLKIDWLPRKFIKKLRRRLWLQHPMKNYKMINRLKKVTWHIK